MRISDWSSDVCSSDLQAARRSGRARARDHGTGEHRLPVVTDLHLQPVRAADPGGDGRPRPEPAAAGPGDDHPSADAVPGVCRLRGAVRLRRSEEHTSELQSLMRISYAVLCLTRKITIQLNISHIH